MAGRQWRQGPRVKGRQGIGKYEVKVMGQEKKKGIMAAGTLLALTLYAGTAWASDGRWEYNDVKNQWRYRDGEEGHVTGKRELDGETYFFDGDGVMLTGWVRCPKGEIPEPYSDAMDGEDIYYCGDDGKMAKGWVVFYNPEQASYEKQQQFDRIQEEGYGQKRYYFDEKGKPCQNERKNIDGKRYIFDEEGAVMDGWIYDRGEGQADRFLSVDTDSPEADKELCRANPDHLLYGALGDGSLATGQWVDTVPPWDDEDDDARSFYADSSSYMVSGRGARGDGTSLSARRKARKIEEVGTYRLEDWSTDVNITKIGGNYYCLEDSGTRIDGMLYLSGAEGDSSFRDGLYCFMDHAAMKTGAVMKENTNDDFGSDGYVYYYYFSEKPNSKYSKGQGITGVSAGRLYYQGLAVGAQDETYEVVYVPALEEKDDTGKGTGLFLVDASGKVKKGSLGGSHYRSSNGNEYRVVKESGRNDEYGYVIQYYDGEKDDSNHKIWKSLTEGDYSYICWDIAEE